MPAASPIAALRARYLAHQANPLTVLDEALAHSNANSSHNTYLAQDLPWSRAEALNLDPANLATQPLWGIPVSLKDCFDLAGFPTSAGSTFYRDLNGPATADSTVAARLRAAGALITGKTHLHQLAYGITGENADFGDCTQPAPQPSSSNTHPGRLPGGSSSGAAVSVLEGSALAAIGTDTGGSIRTPAALCGLAGYRSSITLNTGPHHDLWRGGAHLAPTFDTLGWLYRDLRDGPVLAQALLDLPIAPSPTLAHLRIGLPAPTFLHDCEPDVLHTYLALQLRLKHLDMRLTTFDSTIWDDAFSILAPIQASEAAALHRGHFHHFEPAIAQRLAGGAAVSPADLAAHLARLTTFRSLTYALFDTFDYLLLPCAPMSTLLAGADHTHTRPRILRYTAPASLTGLPVVTIPGFQNHQPAGGLQLIAPLNHDANLLALSTLLA